MSLRKVCFLLNTLRYTILLTWCSLKERCINLSGLKVYITYYSKRKQPTLYTCRIVPLLLGHLKKYSCARWFFLRFYKKFFNYFRKENNIFAVYVLTFIYKILLKAIRPWDLVGIERYWLRFENFNLSIPQYILCCTPPPLPLALF